MEKHIKIRMKLFTLFLLIFGSVEGEVYSQPDQPDIWPPYASKTYTTIKTPKGEDVEAILYTDTIEWPEYWEDYGAWLVDIMDWDATWQDAATHEYNCHGYAWYKSEGGSNVWINYEDRFGNPNLLKYWTGLQSYIPAASSANGRKVNYIDDDHSAITTTSTSYVKSKWGCLPVYRHLKIHCPYTSTNLGYYQLNPNMTGITSLLCYNIQRTFNTNITNMPQATLTWTPGPYISYVSGAGTPQYTVKGAGNGNSYVNFQISTPSGFSWSSRKNFWAGKPVPTITGEQYPECGDINWYFLDWDDYWGTYYWNVTNGLTIIGSPYGTKAKIRADEGGTNAVYCDVTNACGTNYGSLPVYVDCFGFRMSPNPADDYLEISLDENKVDISNITEYEVKIYNIQEFLIYQTKTKESSFIINTSNYIPGIYSVQLIYNGKAYSQQLVINH